MGKAISNTSPLLYLYRIGVVEWLGQLFDEVWVADAVLAELEEGRRRGYDVPRPEEYAWVYRVNPRYLPAEWFALDLGRGELAAMALGLEHPDDVVLLDDLLARRVAEAAGLKVWGSLRVLLEGKKAGLTHELAPYVYLQPAHLWLVGGIKTVLWGVQFCQ